MNIYEFFKSFCPNKWLYKLGNEFTDITGGWQARAWTGNGSIWSAVAPGLTKNASNMVASMPDKYTSGKSGVVEIINNVDLTGYNTLHLLLDFNLGGSGWDKDGYSQFYLVTAPVRSGNWTSSSVFSALLLCESQTANASRSATNREYSLDISGVAGAQDVFVGCAWAYQLNASTLTIKEVWLEK